MRFRRWHPGILFIRQCDRGRGSGRQAYWALVESYRTERSPRQRVVAWLGKLDEAGWLGVRQAAGGNGTAVPAEKQSMPFDDECDETRPRWVEVDASAVRIENCRQFGGPWLAVELIRRLKLDEFLTRVMPVGREAVPWSLSSLVLVVNRLLDPSRELSASEQWSPKTALPELLGVPVHRVDDNRQSRTLDELLPHKAALEVPLKKRMGELFDLEYNLLLYDVTSTFFEGRANFDLAQRGDSRDQRSDCKQVGHRPQGGPDWSSPVAAGLWDTKFSPAIQTM